MKLFVSGLKIATIIAPVIIILASIMAIVTFVTFDHYAAEYTSGGKPIQFYRDLDAELLDDYGGLFGIAHNSGNLVAIEKEAIEAGADVIEVDVILVGKELRAAHRSPVPFLGSLLFRGPTLTEIWDAASEVDTIKLDLKDSSPKFLEMLFDFLNKRKDHDVIISSRDPQVLKLVMERAPQAIRLLSISSARRFEELQKDEALQMLINGVTIKHQILNEERATWLHEKGVLVFVWTVNDLHRVNALVKYGVSGIATDNLAIMELLGEQDRGQVTLRSLLSR
ncbi:MAG: glycerophosphodiester phosphodiesterase [Chloroflexi bacterium]|nr:glycerophosphodiester phosphodiesterase [Chloroflexota bacterium]